jgi:predicted TIM-barrel fold metal-dependent hydrolase
MLTVIIDFHTHIFAPGIREKRADYVVRDACFSLLYSRTEARMVTAEELISNMDACGIDKSVVLNIGWQSHEMCRETNDYILESVARYPRRLIGFCSVQPASGDKAIEEIQRCARGGARGVGEMRPDVQSFDLRDKALLKPLIETIMAEDMVLLVHASEPVGHLYDGKGQVTPDVLYPFILDFPGLKLVCAHWGGGLPFYALMPEVEKALVNVFWDTAATPFLYQPRIFHHVAEIAGSRRILFGSDYPLLSPERIIEQVKSAILSSEDKAGILGGNAARLLSIK